MKQKLASILCIGFILLTASTGTYAYFVDADKIAGNTFTAGIFDLLLKDNDEPWKDHVTKTWSASNMVPGQSLNFDVEQVDLRIDSTIPVNHVEIAIDYSVIEETPQTKSDTDPNTNLHPDNMARQLIITKCLYYGSASINCLTDSNADRRINDYDGDGRITFYDFKNDPLDNLPPISIMGGFQMSIKLDENAGNDFQGDTFDLTMYFTANQDASQ